MIDLTAASGRDLYSKLSSWLVGAKMGNQALFKSMSLDKVVCDIDQGSMAITIYVNSEETGLPSVKMTLGGDGRLYLDGAFQIEPADLGDYRRCVVMAHLIATNVKWTSNLVA